MAGSPEALSRPGATPENAIKPGVAYHLSNAADQAKEWGAQLGEQGKEWAGKLQGVYDKAKVQVRFQKAAIGKVLGAGADEPESKKDGPDAPKSSS